MATLPSTPRTEETPTGTVIGIAISLAVVVFLFFVYFHHKWTKRVQPRACLVYEESATSSSDEDIPRYARAPRRYRGGRRYREGDGHREERGHRVQGSRWWWRRWRHPHAYCRECEARRERQRGRTGRAAMRDIESGDKNVRRPRPTYAPYAAKDYTGRWAQDHDIGNGNEYEGDWQNEQYSAADEQGKQPQWKRTRNRGYEGNRGTARVPDGVRATNERAQQGQRGVRGNPHQNWRALQWQYGNTAGGDQSR